jgi:hypothetical protein
METNMDLKISVTKRWKLIVNEEPADRGCPLGYTSYGICEILLNGSKKIILKDGIEDKAVAQRIIRMHNRSIGDLTETARQLWEQKRELEFHGKEEDIYFDES